MAKKSTKKNSGGLKAGAIAFGATLLLYALSFGLTGLSDYLLGGGLALIVGSLVKVMTTPMKGIEAKNTPMDRRLDPEKITDERAREVVTECLELLRNIRSERNLINEYVFTRRLDELHEKCTKMLNQVLADADKAPRMRKFMNYYLPTTLDLLRDYRAAKQNGASYQDMAATRDQIQGALDMILEASQKQLDAMLQDDLVDMSIDIDVLKQMLKADGLVDSDLKKSLDAQAHAQKAVTEAQRRKQQASHAQAESARPAASDNTPPAVQPQYKVEGVTMAATPDAVPQPRAEGTPCPELQVPAPATASAHQLQQGVPVLNVPVSDEKEADFDSFFKNKTML